MRRLLVIPFGIFRESKGAWRHSDDLTSFSRLFMDIVMYRVLRLWPGLGRLASTRTVRLDGSSIAYRLDRGDIQSIREVWFDQIYCLPHGNQVETLLDLGANIGLASVWLSANYNFQTVIAVEPDPDNLRLARHNLAVNSVPGEVIEAAIGPEDGVGAFSQASQSNLGRLASAADPASVAVSVRTPESLLRDMGVTAVDVCKIDIEGGEEDLFLHGDPTWLQGVGALVIEIHAAFIDADAVAHAIEENGLEGLPMGVAGRKMPWFVSEGVNVRA